MLSIRNARVDNLIERLKAKAEFPKFQSVLHEKVENERKAKEILEQNLSRLNKEHIEKIFELVDEPYNLHPSWYGGGPPKWFGMLMNPNGRFMLNESAEKINQWFNVVADNSLSAENRINRLLHKPYRIIYASMGLITLMLYLLDKPKYSIWFEALHEGMRELYPDIGKYRATAKDYILFNQVAKAFVKEYGFNDTELDYILTAVTRMRDGTIF